MRIRMFWLTTVILMMIFFPTNTLNGNEGGNERGNERFILKGAGATFPYPLYKKWINIYQTKNGVRIHYHLVGSGRGISELLQRNVDFGATDAFMSLKEMKSAKDEVLHIPTCLGAVVVTYNLPGNPELRLTPSVIEAIFLGDINRWNDSRIAKINPDAQLPDLKISVVHRSDGSGTTFIFTNYLSNTGSLWKKKIGAGKIVKWPTGLGLEKNNGVVNFVKKIPGAIGYTELTYAMRFNMPAAVIQNKTGIFIKPSLETVSKAANTKLPDDTRTLIINNDAPKGYPISAFTWLIFYKEQAYNNRSFERAKALARFLWWTAHEAQKHTGKMTYAPLPAEAVKKVETIIRSMTYNKEKLVDW